jgi:glutamate-1-semialdehyde 2,1-aminomutase
MKDYLKEYMSKTPGSAKLYARAVQVMPGGVSHNFRYFPPYPLYIRRASGSKIWDVDGNEYIDLWMGHYTHILGHNPEPIKRVLEEKVSEGTHWGIVHEYQVAFAEDLCRLIPCAQKIRFGVSGTEATMYAARLGRGFTGRKMILKVRGGWHGAGTDLSTAVHAPMDEPESAGLPPGAEDQIQAFSFNDKEGAIAAIQGVAPDLAGVILEAVGQYFIPPELEFLEAVQQETRKAGALFILDEVITGGRLSLRGAQGKYGLQPDLATFGKVLGGGLNLSILAGRKEIMDLASPTAGFRKGKGVLIGGGTFSCMPLSMIAGRTMLKYLEDHERDIYPTLEEKGLELCNGLESVFRTQAIAVRYFRVGSLFSTCFPPTADITLKNNEDVETQTDLFRRDQEFRLRMLNKGVYLVDGGGAISTAHTDEDIQRIIAAAEESAKEMEPIP